MPRPTVPPALAVNALGFLGALEASGDQIYCLGNDGIWRYIRPEATLYVYRENEKDGGQVPTAVASHFGTLLDDGTGNYAPTWQQTYDTDDNSSVQATRVASVDAPDPVKDIPWLKLKVATTAGPDL